MSVRSIRFRLAAWFTLLLAAILLTAGIGAWFALRASIHATAAKDLKPRMDAMHQFLRKMLAEQDNTSLAEELEEERALSPVGAVFRIANSGKWIYVTGAWDAADAAGDVDDQTLSNALIGGKPYRVFSTQFRSGPDLWRVEIASPLEELYELLNGATVTALLASPLLLLLAAAGGYWMAGRVLAPVDSITRTAQAIGAVGLAQRLPLSGTGDELDRLSETLNAMFARLEESFARVQKFSADASHELRTPVAIMRMTAELALSKTRSEADYQQALGRVLRESERVTQLIEDLLRLARMDAAVAVAPFERVDLALLFAEACEGMQLLGEVRGVAVSTDFCAGCFVVGDGEALRRLLLILVDNAIKFTASGGVVKAVLVAGERDVLLEVSDTGRGIAASDIDRIFERFYRPEEHRSRDSGGVGVGLGIARRIVDLHSGAI